MKTFKIFLWIFIAYIPTAAACVFIVCSMQGDTLIQAYHMALNGNIENASLIISNSVPYITVFSILYIASTISAIIPMVYKIYEYSMIPMILSDNPDINCREAFSKSRAMMSGFRLKYFLVQLSFAVYYILLSMLIVFVSSYLIYLIALAILLPYRYMTFIEFYRQRQDFVDKFGKQVQEW